MSFDGPGVPRDRVVAVVVKLRDDLEQVGSGYLIGPSLVLTAYHCTRDRTGKHSVRGLKVLWSRDGSVLDEDPEILPCPGLDVAVLRLASEAVESGVSRPKYARVDRSRSGILNDCQAIGYPLYQRDPNARIRGTGEVHGIIYQTDEAETGRLLLREPLTDPGPIAEPGSPWDGLSGAVVFQAGHALGIIVEHHPRQGAAAVQLAAFDTVAQKALASEDARQVAEALGLPTADALPVASAEPVEPLAGLVDLIAGSDLPRVIELDPYRLGTTPSSYGDQHSHGEQDPYVPRTHDEVDMRLRAALEPGQLVIVVGPSKAGKTRTAYEAIQNRWPDARLLAPAPAALGRLIRHPRLQTTSDPLLVWLDDLNRFLTTSDPLTPASLNQLIGRPGPTILLATLRQEARARLADASGELSRDARQLLQAAEQIDLQRTSDNLTERDAAAAAYPGEDLSTAGLAEQLAGAPVLLQQYRDARLKDPLYHAVLQVAIDWARIGIREPISENDLCALALDTLWETRPDLDYELHDALEAVKTARRPPEGAGQVAALTTHPGPLRTRSYRPFDYLIAADDGQDSQPRAIPEPFWAQALERCTPDDAAGVGLTADERDLTSQAIAAFRRAAASGDTYATARLGYLLADRSDPPDLDEARQWYEQAAAVGDTYAMTNLGYLLSVQLDPPDLDEARQWYERAAALGDARAMTYLGNLLADRLDPPDLDEARQWYEQAAAAGDTDAITNLGDLLLFALKPPELDEARQWYERAIAVGDERARRAMTNLGVLLMDWLDPPDFEQARRWYEQAAADGDLRAMAYLGELLADRLDPPDLEQARQWYEQAAAGGYTDAMTDLGDLLADRLDPPDLDHARHWYEQAAAGGDPRATTNLAALADRLDPPDLDQARR